MLVELNDGCIQAGFNRMERTPSTAFEMDWSRKKYRVQLNNGDRQSVAGTSNGLFGLSDGGVLTHLATATGSRAFPDQPAGRAAGDYLATAYAEEFKALDRAFRKAMTYDQFRALSEAADLNAKINHDQHYIRLLAAAGAE